LGYLWRALRWQAFLAPLTKSSLREVWIATTVGFGAVLLVGRAAEVRAAGGTADARQARASRSIFRHNHGRAFVRHDGRGFVLCVNLLWFRPAPGTAADFSRARIVGWVLVALLGVAIAMLIWFKRRYQSVIGWLDKTISDGSRLRSRLKRAC